MTTRFVEFEHDRDLAVKYVAGMDLPFTLTLVKGKKRSLAQNRLSHQWYKDAAEQLGDMTPEEVRAYCKLTIGVPILREDESFREKYDRIVKPLSYADKLEIMGPLDFGVTRLMSTKQLTRYLDEMQRHYAEQGIILTTPEWADFMKGPK